MNTDTQLQRIPSSSVPALPAEAFTYWADLAIKFEHGSLASQVMAGFSLLELRGQKSAQGQRTDLTSPHDVVKLGWQKTVEAYGKISDETAYRWMKMAEGLKARFKKLQGLDRLRALLESPPSEWSPKEIEFIAEHVAKATDGMTQTDFLRELGLAKKKQGNNDPTPGPARRLTLSEKEAKAIELAMQDSAQMGKWILQSNGSFILTTRDNDIELDAQISFLESALKLRMKYRNVPRSRRDETLVKEIERMALQIKEP